MIPLKNTILGRARRRLYKPDRVPDRDEGVLSKQAPVACLDANVKEIAMALFSICESVGVVVGRGADYDPLRDMYTVVGKSRATGKAQDFKVEGGHVAALIWLLRGLNGVRRFDPQAAAKALSPTK